MALSEIHFSVFNLQEGYQGTDEGQKYKA